MKIKKCIKKIVPDYIFFRKMIKIVEEEQMETQLEFHKDLWSNNKQKRKLIKDCKHAERKYGAYPECYFENKFYEKTDLERKKYVTQTKLYCLVKVLNEHEDNKYLKDKTLFCKHFKEYLGRGFLDVQNATYDEFKTFFKKYPDIIVKDKDGYCGLGTYKMHNENISDKEIDDIYKKFLKKSIIVEEVIKQDGILHELNPDSVNTVRICTMFVDGKAEIFQGILNMGNGDICVDNWNHGGIFAEIDVETGVVYSRGYHLSGVDYIKHPITNTQIVGIQIPHWKEVTEKVKEAAAKLPNVKYISWDVAISESGKICIIEGNFCGDAQWSYAKGIMPIFEKYLERYGLLNEYNKTFKHYYKDPYFAK